MTSPRNRRHRSNAFALDFSALPLEDRPEGRQEMTIPQNLASRAMTSISRRSTNSSSSLHQHQHSSYAVFGASLLWGSQVGSTHAATAHTTGSAGQILPPSPGRNSSHHTDRSRLPSVNPPSSGFGPIIAVQAPTPVGGPHITVQAPTSVDSGGRSTSGQSQRSQADPSRDHSSLSSGSRRGSRHPKRARRQ